VKQDTTTKQIGTAVNDGWMKAGSFLNSILAGALLGYYADRWLGTEPWLVVTGIVLGSYSGFLRIWALLKEQDGDPYDR
jgi:ATP synthase protein I